MSIEDLLTEKYSWARHRKVLDAITSAAAAFHRRKRELYIQNPPEDVGRRELRKARTKRDEAIRNAINALRAHVDKELTDASQPPRRNLSGDGWAELNYRVNALALQVASARPDEALAIYQRAVAEAPEYMRSELAKVVQPRISGDLRIAREFERIQRANRSDVETKREAERRAARTMQHQLDRLDSHIGRLIENSEAPDPDFDGGGRLLNLWLDSTKEAAGKAAAQAIDDETEEVS